MNEQNRILDELRAKGLFRSMRNISTPQEVEIELEGRRVINFSGNNSLGLATDPSLVEAARAGLDRYGLGSGASRLISGNMDPHERLEKELAAFTRRERALYFPSGYQANTGAIPALTTDKFVILSDELNHASLIDGIRLSRAERCIYAHNNVDALARALEEVPREKPVLVVTEALFSMAGDRAPLAEIAALKKKRPFLLYVDEAHSIGAIGPEGRGGVAEARCNDAVDILLGTLGKAFGMSGAFIAGNRTIADLLINRSRTFIYTTAPPPALACAATKALELVLKGDARRKRLAEKIKLFRSLIKKITGHAPDGIDHIVPVPVNGAEKVMQASAALLEHGIFCQGIRPPTVPEGKCCLRFSLSAQHGRVHLDKAADALAQVLATIGA